MSFPGLWQDMARRLGIGLILVVATVAVYAPISGFEFVDLDDNVYVTENEHLRNGLNGRALRWSLTAGRASNWHPVTWMSHALDVELYGLDPGGHHVSSLVIHVVSTLLLFALLVTATRRTVPAAIVAALFALHPLNVESVAWVAERKNVLSTLFGLLSMLAYVAYARRGGVGRYLVAAALLALGLSAKPMLVTLPFVFLLLDYWPLERLWGTRETDAAPAGPGRLVIEKLPLFLMALASSVITYRVQSSAIVAVGDTLPVTARISNAVVSYVRYVGKAIWPEDLAVLYVHPRQAGGVPWSVWQVVGSLLLLLAIIALALAVRRRYAVVGWLWFLGTLVPVIGLVQVGNQAMADRYAYVPLIGLSIAVVWAGAELLEPAAARRPAIRAVAALGIVAILTGYAVASRRQTRYWQDSVALFERGLAVSPTNPTLLFNLGTVLEKQGHLKDAEQRYRRALEVKPNYGRAHFGLANALSRSGGTPEAIRHYRLALDLRPDHAEAHFNLANQLRSVGGLANAIEHYRKALGIRPGWTDARNNLATAYLIVGELDNAIDELLRLVAAEPTMPEARNNLGIALVRSGRDAEALEQFREAARLETGSFTPLVSAAWILATSADAAVRDPDRAVDWAERGATLAGRNQPVALDTLAAAYASKGRFDDAVRIAEQALDVAHQAERDRLTSRIRGRLDLYRKGVPYVQRAGSTAP